MAIYSLNLPPQLQKEAKKLADRQGISLEQFILWALAEKVGSLNAPIDDPAFPMITYSCGASGELSPILRGTKLRVKTIVVAFHHWGLSAKEVAEEYDLLESQVYEMLKFYAAYPSGIDAAIGAEKILEASNA